MVVPKAAGPNTSRRLELPQSSPLYYPNMLGLNPHAPHPFQSMLPGLHAHAQAQAAAASMAAAVNNLPPPPTTVSSAAAAAAAAASGAAPPPGMPGINMWPLILSHITNLLPQLSIAKMDPLSQVFCLRWNNHRNNLLTVLDHLLQTEAFCDVTLAVDGASIKCHKMILSACSSYFQQLFMENTCEHPIVFLKDIKFEDMRAVLDYMYKGEVNVTQEQLPGLLKVAELLKIKGLVEEEREKMLKEGRPVVSTTDERGNDDIRKLNGDHKEANAAGLNGPISPALRLPFGAPGNQFPLTWPIFSPSNPQGLMGANREKVAEKDRDNGNASSSSSDRLDSIVPEKEGSPSPKENLVGSAKRKKTSSGSGGSNSSKDDAASNPTLPPAMDDKIHGMEERNDMAKTGDNGVLGMPPGMDKSQLANYVPNQRLEWKRYKQYTRQDIMSAIEEVKKGMSALQASRKYGVPSRTLYDKVKKMGITTGRQMQRKSLPNYPTSFPPSLGGMMDFHKEMADRMKDDDTNDSSSAHGSDLSTDRSGLDGRATMVPPVGASFPTLQMLKIMENMKENSGSGKGEHDVSLMPMNLSTMLSNAASRDMSAIGAPPGQSKRSPSESSLSPNGDDVDEDAGADAKDNRQRHASADIRAQFMADLRRLGGNIPTQSGQSASSSEEAGVASSTTASPPPLTATSSAHSTPQKSSDTEKDLPPRKRKVSQEHHAAGGGLPSGPVLKAPYNGIHEEEEPAAGDDAEAKSPKNASDAQSADSGGAHRSLECRN